MNTHLLIAFLLENMIAVSESKANNINKRTIGFYIPMKLPILCEDGNTVNVIKRYDKFIMLVTPEPKVCNNSDEYHLAYNDAIKYMSRMLDTAFNTGIFELTNGVKYNIDKAEVLKRGVEVLASKTNVTLSIII